MVTFTCDKCNESLKKNKVKNHISAGPCRGSTVTCIDCFKTFPGMEFDAHTSCISEAERYQGKLYKSPKPKSAPVPPPPPPKAKSPPPPTFDWAAGCETIDFDWKKETKKILRRDKKLPKDELENELRMKFLQEVRKQIDPAINKMMDKKISRNKKITVVDGKYVLKSSLKKE
ncbi:putative cell growth-regulating nucleolar protein [Blattamonas nauphoetae]|uniref:Cell growth-regulating nucleolar protein n=1 Tax=Blattamonas nauphoetae TaxID=2049346 RepID=A0ABQ9YAN1_9EUKA|nr:putative cell growth-regulating nucleolar protein [Blattamonas nauphoetae]